MTHQSDDQWLVLAPSGWQPVHLPKLCIHSRVCIVVHTISKLLLAGSPTDIVYIRFRAGFMQICFRLAPRSVITCNVLNFL